MIKFTLGNITYHYSLSKKEKELLNLANPTFINLNENNYFSSMIESSILNAIHEDHLPPTEKEIKHVEMIAHDLNLLLPKNYKQSVIVCRQFIHQYKYEHDKSMAVFNNIKGQLLK